jgi:hypothetical protein
VERLFFISEGREFQSKGPWIDIELCLVDVMECFMKRLESWADRVRWACEAATRVNRLIVGVGVDKGEYMTL